MTTVMYKGWAVTDTTCDYCVGDIARDESVVIIMTYQEHGDPCCSTPVIGTYHDVCAERYAITLRSIQEKTALIHFDKMT